MAQQLVQQHAHQHNICIGYMILLFVICVTLPYALIVLIQVLNVLAVILLPTIDSCIILPAYIFALMAMKVIGLLGFVICVLWACIAIKMCAILSVLCTIMPMIILGLVFYLEDTL